MSALRAEGYELGSLLECAGPARSGYCYALSHPAGPTRPGPRGAVAEIFSRAADGCGRRRVAMCLRAGPGARMADKTVLKMMREMGVRRGIRRETDCHRYSSCRGAVGETSGSVIGRDFAADGPWQKMGADVAGFKQPWGRACFAPVHDFGSEEMVAWSASASPDMARQAELLDRLLAKMPEGATPVLHGDMGRQHRHAAWRGRLRGAGIVQSMSRKGNCIDNGATEQVFGHMRDEFFRGRAWPDFESSKADLDWIGYTDVDSSGRGARDGRAVYEGPQAPEAFHRRVQEADSRPLQRRKAQARDHGRVRPRQEHRGEVDQVDKRDRLAARRGQPHARAEPDPGARAREPQAPDGGRRLKTSGADIRSKVRAIAANEGRYPISAQCRLLGVARSTYYSMRSRAGRPAAPDPAAPAVVAAHAASKGRYGSRKIKASLERSGVTVSRRRVCRIMRENGLVSAYGRKRFKVHPGAVNEADVPNVVARGFGGRAPRTHICSDLTYVRVGASWNYVCLLVDLYNREIVGHSAGPRKDARLVKSAFATLSFPISDIEVFHTDRGSEFDNAEIDLMLEAFGIERSLSAKGCPYDNAVDESTNRILKAELVHRETFGTTRELRAKLSDYVHWYNNFRIHSTLGYMSPVEFREAGLSLPESSK